jgi:hypothetical protein
MWHLTSEHAMCNGHGSTCARSGIPNKHPTIKHTQLLASRDTSHQGQSQSWCEQFVSACFGAQSWQRADDGCLRGSRRAIACSNS